MGDKKRWRQHYPLVDEIKDPKELMIIAQVEKAAVAIYAECPSLHAMVSNGERGVLTYGLLNMMHRAMPDTFPVVGNDDIPTREILAARTILFGQEIDVAEVIAPTRIINLTKHMATPPQVAEGVEDLPADFRRCLLDILNFEKCPDNMELRSRALRVKGLLADHLRSAEAIRGATVMIGGMPAFDTVLEAVLKESGVHVGYSFTKRQCTETALDGGAVALLYVSKHEGFIWVS